MRDLAHMLPPQPQGRPIRPHPNSPSHSLSAHHPRRRRSNLVPRETDLSTSLPAPEPTRPLAVVIPSSASTGALMSPIHRGPKRHSVKGLPQPATNGVDCDLVPLGLIPSALLRQSSKKSLPAVGGGGGGGGVAAAPGSPVRRRPSMGSPPPRPRRRHSRLKVDTTPPRAPQAPGSAHRRLQRSNSGLAPPARPGIPPPSPISTPSPPSPTSSSTVVSPFNFSSERRLSRPGSGRRLVQGTGSPVNHTAHQPRPPSSPSNYGMGSPTSSVMSSPRRQSMDCSEVESKMESLRLPSRAFKRDEGRASRPGTPSPRGSMPMGGPARKQRRRDPTYIKQLESIREIDLAPTKTAGPPPLPLIFPRAG